jgi:hypothetical protein
VEEEKESLACYLGYGERREGLLLLCLEFSSYYRFLKESREMEGNKLLVLAMEDQSSKSAVFL